MATYNVRYTMTFGGIEKNSTKFQIFLLKENIVVFNKNQTTSLFSCIIILLIKKNCICL